MFDRKIHLDRGGFILTDAWNAAQRGAMAGAMATVPMSAVMLAAGKLGLMGRQPPKAVAEKGLEAAGVQPDEEVKDTLASLSHIVFGAAAGAAYGFLHRQFGRRRWSATKGIGYGLLVYLVSYEGWIPAFHILPPPEADRSGRQLSMIAAHVVYGGVLGALVGDRALAPTRMGDPPPERSPA